MGSDKIDSWNHGNDLNLLEIGTLKLTVVFNQVHVIPIECLRESHEFEVYKQNEKRLQFRSSKGAMVWMLMLI